MTLYMVQRATIAQNRPKPQATVVFKRKIGYGERKGGRIVTEMPAVKVARLAADVTKDMEKMHIDVVPTGEN